AGMTPRKRKAWKTRRRGHARATNGRSAYDVFQGRAALTREALKPKTRRSGTLARTQAEAGRAPGAHPNRLLVQTCALPRRPKRSPRPASGLAKRRRRDICRALRLSPRLPTPGTGAVTAGHSLTGVRT